MDDCANPVCRFSPEGAACDSPGQRPGDWQAGYGAFSIGESGVPALKGYIAGQKERHRTRTFQQEFRAFLSKYNVAFDERYVWD